MTVYLNLLIMTARIKRTRTVMIAMVIILFVAILSSVSLRLLSGCKRKRVSITYEPSASMSCYFCRCIPHPREECLWCAR
jgi:hypothetical protein